MAWCMCLSCAMFQAFQRLPSCLAGLEADGVLGWELGKDPCTSDGGQIRDALGQRPLEVNSMVQIQYKEGELAFGIIRWMGYLPQMEDKMAGVELEEEKGCTDGTWQSQQYFVCPLKRGIFVKLKACQPDTRFLCNQDSLPKSLDSGAHSGAGSPTIVEKIPPLQGCEAVDVLQGRMRGIQGHCNSCYMDAALFRYCTAGQDPPCVTQLASRCM
ncbi:hypothetical protein FKM82_021278 [Ascaphus truei]